MDALRITGTVILCILIFLICISLVILVSPIKYTGRVTYDGKFSCAAEGRYLLGILKYEMDSRGNSNTYVFGIRLREKPEEKKTEKDRKENPEGFFTMERIFRMFPLVKDDVLKLLKKVMPGEISGYVEYGTGDPYTTGRITEFLTFIYPLVGDGLKITPLFDREYLKGDIRASGSVRTVSLMRTWRKIKRNREIARMVREYRQGN